MTQTGIGVKLKRLFVRSEPSQAELALGAEPPDGGLPAARRGPPLVLLVPGVAGVSTYQMRPFEDSHSAAAFIEGCDPYRVYKEGIIAFWALHERPLDNADAECAVLIRTEPASDLVHAYAFTDLDIAASYVRFRVEDNSVPADAFIVHWAVSIRINANPSGEVRLEPALPPVPIRDMRTSPADGVVFRDDVAEVMERVPPPAPDVAPGFRPSEIEVALESEAELPEPEETARVRECDQPAPAQTHWSRRAGSRKLPARIKAHVLALGLLGFAPREIEKELHAMYPDDRVPAYATISRWLRRAGISHSFLKRWETMSERAMRELENRLAELDDAPLSEVARVAALLEGMRRK